MAPDGESFFSLDVGGQPITSPSRESLAAVSLSQPDHIETLVSNLSSALLPSFSAPCALTVETRLEAPAGDKDACFGPLSPKGPMMKMGGPPPQMEDQALAPAGDAAVSAQPLPAPQQPTPPQQMQSEPTTGVRTSPARPGLLHLVDDNELQQVTPSPILAFINDLTRQIPPPLCATPPPPPPPPPAKLSKAASAPTRSSRLAAKATAGLSTMEKVKMVLLKKHGHEADKENPKEALKKYSDIYKQQLPPAYINAIAALVDQAKPGRKGEGTVLMEAVTAA